MKVWRRPDEDSECTILHVHLDQTELCDTTNWSQVEEKAHRIQLFLMRVKKQPHAPVGQWEAGGCLRSQRSVGSQRSRRSANNSQRFQSWHVLKSHLNCHCSLTKVLKAVSALIQAALSGLKLCCHSSMCKRRKFKQIIRTCNNLTSPLCWKVTKYIMYLDEGWGWGSVHTIKWSHLTKKER